MQTSHSNTVSLSELNKAAWECRYIDREKSMNLATKAKDYSIKKNNQKEFYFAQITIAQLSFWQLSDSSHLITLNAAISFFEEINETLGISRANAVCAGMYDQFGQYERAMQHALNSVKTSELIDEENNKADCYTILGQIYSRVHDYTKAIHSLTVGLELRKKFKDEKATASSLNLIARNFALAKNYDEAKRYYEESLVLRESIKDIDGIPWTFLGLASLFSEKKVWEQAIDFYNKAIRSNQKKEERFELLCLIGISKIYLNQGKTNDAILLLKKALLIADALKIISLKSEIHMLLSEAWEKTNDLRQALFHYKFHHDLLQEILSNEKINSLKNQEIAFSVESSEKEAEIHRLKNVELKNAFDKIATQHHELEEKNQEITASISYAKRIQDAYLPEKELLHKLFPDAFLLFKPKDIVSGDFYWYNKITSPVPSLLFAAADCTGHGVPGAIMSVICCNALNEVVINKNIYRPDLILNEVRNIVASSFQKEGEATQKDGMDISLVRLIHESNKTLLQYSGANNPLWIIRKGIPLVEHENIVTSDTHYLIEMKADKQPIGNFEKMLPFTLNQMDVKPGDTIYSFSDGYADQFGGEYGKKLKYRPLKDLLLSIQQHSMETQKNILVKAYNDWKRDLEQIDDVCIIGVRI